MKTPAFLEYHAKMCATLRKVTKKKNSDYTGGIEGDPFANFKQIKNLIEIPNIVEIGILTRMSDKMSRIGSFIKQGVLHVEDETIHDTLLDLANYPILLSAFIYSESQKPKPKKDRFKGRLNRDRNEPDLDEETRSYGTEDDC